MTPRTRWRVGIAGAGLATVVVACLNPQPLPPSDFTAEVDDAGASYNGDSGSAFGGSDASATDTPSTDAGDAGDAGDASDAGDAGDAGE